jgi:hypothetical protein
MKFLLKEVLNRRSDILKFKKLLLYLLGLLVALNETY